MNDIKHYDLNPDNYTREQIYELLNIHEKEPSIDKIKKKVKLIIANLKQKNEFELIEFIKKIENIAITDDSPEYYLNHKIENTTHISVEGVSDDELEEDEDKKVEGADIDTNYMLLPPKLFRDTIDNTNNIYKKDNPDFNINRNYSVPGIGAIRQNIDNIYVRKQIVNINSKFRKNNYVSYIAAFNGIDTDKPSDQKYVKNELGVFDTTDFNVNLSEPLTNVVSMRLYSVCIPYTFYNISSSYGNNCFFWKVLEKNVEDEELIDKFNNTDQDTYEILLLQDGQYLPFSTLGNDIFVNINQDIEFSKYFKMEYDATTGKTKLIILSNVDRFKLLFYNKEFDTNKTEFRNKSDAFRVYSDKIKKLKCNNNAKSNLTKIDTSLGYLLGFRNVLYTEQDIMYKEPIESIIINNRFDNSSINSFINNVSDPPSDTKSKYIGGLSFIFSESLVDLFGTKYFVIAIDDFQKNSFNNSILTLESIDPIPSRHNYNTNLKTNRDGEQNKAACNKKDFRVLEEVKPDIIYSGGGSSGGYSKNLTATKIPSLKIPKSKAYSINAINETAEKTKDLPDTSDQIARKNILGFVPIKKSFEHNLGDYYTEFGGTLQNNERHYTGPVDIQKLKIQLFNDNGQLIDLNNHDWSFSLIIEHQYQY